MDPLEQSIQPVPASPPEAPAISRGASTLSQEEMRANMDSTMGQLKGRFGDFQAKKFTMDNNAEESQGMLLREIFAFFESVGVDPNNPEELNAYLEQLKVEDPEQYQQIESLIDGILGPEASATPEAAPAVSGNVPVTPEVGQVPPNMNINTPNEIPLENL